MECTKVVNIKEEIDIDWDERDNFYETKLDNTKTESSVAIILKRSSNATIENNTVNNRKKNPMECPKCNKVLRMKITYDRHVSNCGKERHLQCAHCSYKTKHRDSLIRHIDKQHSEGSNTFATGTKNGQIIVKYCQKCDKILDKVLNPINCEKCFSKFIYQCSKCKKMFDKYKPAYHHWRTTCGVKGYYCCNLCDYKGVDRSSVKLHVKRNHKNSQSFETMTWKSLFNSSKTQEFPSYECQKFGKPVRDAVKLKRHMSLCKGLGNIKKLPASSTTIDFNPTRCSTCGKKFEHVYVLNRHIPFCMKYQHASKRINDNEEEIIEVVEDHPPINFIAPEEIHQDIKHRAIQCCKTCQVESDIEKKYGKTYGSKKLSCSQCKSYLTFKCKNCFKEFPKINSILPHLKLVCTSGEEYECTECNFKGKSATSVRKHYKTVHVVANKECSRCGKVFKNPNSCRVHLQICGVEPKFQCEHCPYKSKLKEVSKQHIVCKHMNISVVDKNALVKISQQRFSRLLTKLEVHCSKCKKKQLLRNRLKMCKDCKTKLNFKCTPCKKSFSTDDKDACDHLNAYLEMTKFECKRCGRGLISEASLRVHKKHHDRQFSCRFCKFASHSKVATRKHEKTKHPDKV